MAIFNKNNKNPSQSVIQNQGIKNKTQLKGQSPGTLVINLDSPKPKFTVYFYDKQHFEEHFPDKVSELAALLKENTKKYWVRVQGLSDEKILRDLADIFSIHRLTLADIVNRDSRAKTEEFDEHLFIISEAVKEVSKGHLDFDQVSMLLKKEGVITFEEDHGNLLLHIVERLKQGRGHTRDSGSDYLISTIWDLMIDSYFPVIEKYTDELDQIEDDVIGDARKNATREIFALKRSLIMLRRNIFNEREALGDTIRNDSSLITDGTKLVLRDCFDHIEQIRGMIDVSYALAAEIMNIHMSFMNQRMNDLMKLLTIISTLFIPLTFLVGVFGMNFSATPMPEGAANPLNMPELYSPYGYIGFWIFSLGLSLGMLWYFRKRGWFGKSV